MTQKLETALFAVLEDEINPDELSIVVDRVKAVIDNNSDISQIEEFMKTFNQPVREKPQIPSKDEALLRLNLIKEELIELAEACGSEVLSTFGRELFHASQKIHYKCENEREKLTPSIIEALDAFKDLQYVCRGGELAFGFKYIEAEAFQEVHNSNMSKACKSFEEVQETIQMYKDRDNTECVYSEDNNGNFLVTRKSDNKVLKSAKYKPANLDKFFYNGI